jgi:Rps23 Pro-64 3,4-dihydroxylase Tpa1-like proline 4-hydroxylase
MSRLSKPIVVIRDDALPTNTLNSLLAHALSNEANFVEPPVTRNEPNGESPIMERKSRRMSQLRGADGVPANVMDRLRSLVPELASELPNVDPNTVAAGTFEAFITSTPHGGFLRAHADDSHDSTRDRFISFVLYFSVSPRRFTGGQLCVQRDSHDENRIYIFDAFQTTPGNDEFSQVIEPLRNRLVVFRSSRRHEIRPVQCVPYEFAASRFAVAGFVRVK